MNFLKFKLFFLYIVLITLLISCGTPKRKTGFELQKEVWEYTDSDEQKSQIYLTGTKSIDSIDQNKLIYDFFRIEIDQYPDSIKLFARVYDSLGNFVTNMANPYKTTNYDYFKIIDEYLGKVYNIKKSNVPEFFVREFGAKDSIPYNIVLSIDYSGSMDGVMDAIFTGTDIFVDLKFDYDKIAITTFNKAFNIKVPFNDNKNSIKTEFNLRKNQDKGLFSAVFDAIKNNLAMFEGTPEDVPRVMVIFSDGDDNYSKAGIDTIIQKAKEMDVHIFSVAFGYSKDENLQYLSKYTGGKFYKAYTKEQLVSIFRDIYMSLRYYYQISYKPPKYWGYHKVKSYLDIPDRKDSLFAEIDYDTSDLMPWDKIGATFTRPILFDFNKSEIKPESYEIIDEIVDVMMSNPKLKLEIQGHTDNIGGIEFNLKLSEERARSVYNSLVSKGIDESRLRYRGFGFSLPVTSNDTEEGRAKNRRTEFVVLAK